ncbi:hypothetical protein ACFV6F_03300 [Kitasatospora phosalacinea]|uniref:hypothetical protein n=1 Tax=Kitasatospora phosalacinea TaxID=2065 RepID=UPI00365F42DC
MSGDLELHYANLDAAIDDLAASFRQMVDQNEETMSRLKQVLGTELIGQFSGAADAFSAQLSTADSRMSTKIDEAKVVLGDMRDTIRDADMQASTHFDHTR